MIAALAKIDPDQLSFSSEKLEQQSGKSDQIQIVVAEGLEVVVPMAGVLSGQCEQNVFRIGEGV